MSDPIEDKHFKQMNSVARLLDDLFTPYGFALLVFDFENKTGKMNYISNAQRPDMLEALKSFIEKNEAENKPAGPS